MRSVEDLATLVIAIALMLSTVLFGIEVFVKARRAHGQGIGFVFSLIALPLFFIAYCDRLPGRPMGLRNILLIAPGVTKTDLAFSSSLIILTLLVLTYALRLGIYTRLFIIPAFTMTEAEYRSRGRVEQRANDLSASVLAYLTFAFVTTAIVAGAYALPVAAGTALCMALILLYFASPYLRQIRNSLLWLGVQIRIAAREAWLYASKFVVGTIVVIVRLELWRRQTPAGDEAFVNRLEERQRRSEAKARAKIEGEREKLQNLVQREKASSV